MKNYIILILISITFFSFTADNEKLVKTKVTDNITVDLPVSFQQMSEQDINSKYISYRKPLALYTSENKKADFGVNVSLTQWNSNDLDLMKRFFKSSIANLYDKVDFLKEDIEEINNIRYAVFEIISTVNPDENAILSKGAIQKYSYLQYAIVNEKTILFNFTCPLNEKERWQSTVKDIMNSVKVKKSF